MQSDPDSICEVFAKFYEDLYSEAEPAQATQDLTRPDVETLVTADEVIAALKKMKSLKTAADDGLVAEMLKTGHSGLILILAQLFTDILRVGAAAETWKAASLKVIFKKGDVKLPKNYRPISIVLVLIWYRM